jgi:hypothetical protein
MIGDTLQTDGVAYLTTFLSCLRKKKGLHTMLSRIIQNPVRTKPLTAWRLYALLLTGRGLADVCCRAGFFQFERCSEVTFLILDTKEARINHLV